MIISNQLLFNRGAQEMGDAQSKLAQLQAQLAQGKQLVNPSDAPDKAAALQRLNSVLSAQNSYQSSVDNLKTRLGAEDTALNSANNLIVSLKELAVQAANGTLGPQDRQAIATQMQAQRDELLSLANTQDSNGNYLFSGSKVSQPAFAMGASGYPVYQGDQTRMQVKIGDQLSIPLNQTGTDAFVSLNRTDAAGNTQGVGFFQSLDELINGVKNSDQTAMQRGLTEVDAMQQGMSLAQAKVGSNEATLDHQSSVIDATTLNLKTTISNVQDLDYASAVTNMNQQMLSLQAAQTSFAKISQLNLFDYLK
jgi:flagellar hook-associated protein 3 FlgL